MFTTAGGVTVNGIAKWDGRAWSALGSGMGRSDGYGPEVFALAVSETNLYAGGWFTIAGGTSAINIAKWNGSAWSALGSGINVSGGVHALAVVRTNLYAGGYFTAAGGVSANDIAKWDGSAWSALGSGLSGVVAPWVYALAVSGTDLYAGGRFTNAGGVSVNYIAKWDGSAWSALGSGLGASGPNVQPSVSALAVSGTNLYAGGLFTSAGGVPANDIAKRDGSAWSALGSGVSCCPSALAATGWGICSWGEALPTRGPTRAPS